MDVEFIDKNSAEIIIKICLEVNELKKITNTDKLTIIRDNFLLNGTLYNHINRIFASENRTILIDNINLFNIYLETILRYLRDVNEKSDSFYKAELILRNLYHNFINLKNNLNK